MSIYTRSSGKRCVFRFDIEVVGHVSGGFWAYKGADFGLPGQYWGEFDWLLEFNKPLFCRKL